MTKPEVTKVKVEMTITVVAGSTPDVVTDSGIMRPIKIVVQNYYDPGRKTRVAVHGFIRGGGPRSLLRSKYFNLHNYNYELAPQWLTELITEMGYICDYDGCVVHLFPREVSS